MSRKRGKKKPKSSKSKAKTLEAVPEEVLAEGSGPLAEGVAAHVGIDTVAADEPEPVVEPDPEPSTLADLAEAAEAVDVLEAGEHALDEAAVEVGPEAVTAAASAASAADPATFDPLVAVAEETAVEEATDTTDAPVATADDLAAVDDLAADGEAPAEMSATAVDASDAAASDQLEELTDEEAAEMGAVLPTSAATMDAVQLKYLVEALVFASDKPMTLVRLRQLSRVSDTRRLEQALAELAEDYKERGIVLQQVSGGFQFRTRTQFSVWVQQLIAGRPVRLSRAQLETLAIIAYRQPITRPEIDEIRGVDSSATLKLLLDRSLIRVLGKREEVGRPMLYGTTKEFLDFFSLGDLRELPTLREYSELTDESRRVMSDELGLDPDADPMAPLPTDGDLTDEPLADPTAEAEPESIADMVASYSASIDETAKTDAAEPDVTANVSVETGLFAASVDASEPAADEPTEVANEAANETVDEAGDTSRGTEAGDDDLDATAADASAVDVSAVDASAVDGSAVDASAVDGSAVDASAVDGSAVDASEAVDASAFDASEVEASAAAVGLDATADPGATEPAASSDAFDASATAAAADEGVARRSIDADDDAVALGERRGDHRDELDLDAATSTLETLAARRLARESSEELEIDGTSLEVDAEDSAPGDVEDTRVRARATEAEAELGAAGDEGDGEADPEVEPVDTLVAVADASPDDVTPSTDGDTNR